MDGRGGCCIARYAIGSEPYDLSKADRIMLRFRPIAPKPASDGGVKPVSSGDSGGGSSDVSFIRAGRRKRKCHQSKVNGGGNANKRCTRRKKTSEKSVTHGGANAVTLSLLPEKPAVTDLMAVEKEKRQGPLWLSFSDGGGMFTPVVQRTVVISSCMTVERVTDAWIEGYGLGRSDEERKMNLVRDTCPGFISDGSGRVTWTNDAYRKMARDNIPVEEVSPEIINGDSSFHVMVRLVMRERPMLTSPGFTCRVKLQHTCQSRERGSSVTVPCDVWRMDHGGGFAWRLDVKAALCL
ncbi:hypothetical protein CARUB_v10018515mg [Capsella rubella]|uniref:DUF7950 domain-containing protein n=1 Tax=Capsella rubella TaxID=81985 RepID=R0FRI2_9BRAS|nr:uncharacterized protein LOC17886189 [Capsella rubella]EOA25202.1 hypothetical protein CARUB_v10018515mg [Capsella rubella]